MVSCFRIEKVVLKNCITDRFPCRLYDDRTHQVKSYTDAVTVHDIIVLQICVRSTMLNWSRLTEWREVKHSFQFSRQAEAYAKLTEEIQNLQTERNTAAAGNAREEQHTIIIIIV